MRISPKSYRSLCPTEALHKYIEFTYIVHVDDDGEIDDDGGVLVDVSATPGVSPPLTVKGSGRAGTAFRAKCRAVRATNGGVTTTNGDVAMAMAGSSVVPEIDDQRIGQL